jgi:hypothetical protein
MDHFAGLDVSVKETSVCILDDAGNIVKEMKVASEPQALLKVLGNPAYQPRQQHESRLGSKPIGGNSRSTQRWKDVPRGTMDEVSFACPLEPVVQTDDKAAQKIVLLRPRIP